ncbi:MAG TPA: hypothetical protein VE954_01180 [Oligoflexus sp.]|uniref:hypothetical protein n=1 Tax=Oligoflexus sp. TaxID=1971216 RepID=UPI002D675C5E|nr:hypothetical protein [Oligoflexus sp.]HYX31694.1 hypothetical protein [Oligoflexus sp.]
MPEVNFEVNPECRTSWKVIFGKTTVWMRLPFCSQSAGICRLCRCQDFATHFKDLN